jgi:hypothetical protein
MADNNDEPGGEVARTFAGFLSELEDVATRLTMRQSELAGQLAEVEAELARIDAARTAMAKQPGRPGRRAERQATTGARARAIAKWARERGGEFTAREAANAAGTTPNRVGPVLAGMLRRGEATVREDDNGRRRYTLA